MDFSRLEESHGVQWWKRLPYIYMAHVIIISWPFDRVEPPLAINQGKLIRAIYSGLELKSGNVVRGIMH